MWLDSKGVTFSAEFHLSAQRPHVEIFNLGLYFCTYMTANICFSAANRWYNARRRILLVHSKQGLSSSYERKCHANLFHDRTSHMGLQQEHSKAITVRLLGSYSNLKSDVKQTHVPDNEDDMCGISQSTNWPRMTSHSPWVVWIYCRVKEQHQAAMSVVTSTWVSFRWKARHFSQTDLYTH